MFTSKQLFKYPEKKNIPKNQGSVKNYWLEELNITEEDYEWLDEDEILYYKEVSTKQLSTPVRLS